MDPNLPGTSAWHQAQARQAERDQRIQNSPTRRRIAQPLGSGSGPPLLQYQNLPTHLAQQLAALPALQPSLRVRGRGRGRGHGYSHGHGHPAPAPAQYANLPAHLQEGLRLLPAIPAPASRGFGFQLPLAASVVCINYYQFNILLSHYCYFLASATCLSSNNPSPTFTCSTPTHTCPASTYTCPAHCDSYCTSTIQ